MDTRDMMPSKGTSQSLSQAVKRGIVASIGQSRKFQVECIKMHVQEFCAQKFQAAGGPRVSEETTKAVMELWEKIFKKEEDGTPSGQEIADKTLRGIR